MKVPTIIMLIAYAGLVGLLTAVTTNVLHINSDAGIFLVMLMWSAAFILTFRRK